MTTTIGGGFDPYTDDLLYGGGYAAGPYLGPTGIPPPGVAGAGGAINRALHRGPYRRPLI